MDIERLSVLTLNTIIELVPKKIISLIEYFGSANNVLQADIKEIQQIVDITDKTAQMIKERANLKFAQEELLLAQKNSINILTYLDDDYPNQLKTICDYPPILYVKGKLEKNDINSISIVGSRRATNYGKIVTEQFCKYFAQNSITTISGLANGIDTQAHISTIQNHGKTIAVVGNGLLECYPAGNRKLQENILEKGAIISEFNLHQRALPINFPRRNRIIAALSQATIVVESAIKSGSLITAELACEYGKDVFAVPGPIYSKYSQGPNSLIKQGAFIALTPEDIVEQNSVLSNYILKMKKRKNKSVEQNVSSMSQYSINILKMIQSSANGIPLDEISLKANVAVSELSTILLDLELNGFIKSMPGQVYVATAIQMKD
jgi:DNA processing protein